MEMTVTEVGAVVVAELRAAGYLESAIGQYAKTIKVLSGYAGPGGVYSPELGAEFGSRTISPRTGRFSPQRRLDYRRLTAVFGSYVRTGRVELPVRGRGGGGPCPACAGLAALDAAWEAEMAGRGLAAATREAYGRAARGYLAFLEQRGITGLDGADGGSVLAFLESLPGRRAKSSLSWVVSDFRPFLKFTGRAGLVAAVSLAGVRRSRPVIEVLDDAEADMVVRACAAGRVSARNAAITLLAVTTGLRACDIIALRLADVDWRGQAIGIVQRKTGNPLTLPLPALVMGKLAGYVPGERPATADDHVFARVAAPHVRLAGHASAHQVISAASAAAGVADVKAGTRFLRHSTATRLLRAAVPLPAISAVPGHAAQDSASVYINADRERLLQCVLPVPAGARR
jgi:integrase